jgi:oligopeptidase B
MLVTAGYHDSQVQYWEPAKYAARLRDLTTSKNPVLLRIDMSTGHGGATGREQVLREAAEIFGFIVTHS